MTTLAELGRGVVAMQCDICFPPVLTFNTVAELRRTGWLLRSDGQPHDVCPTCATHTTARTRAPRRDAVPARPDPARLPNVVVIGAMKAGTTSMHNYLGLHPEVSVSRDKELRFFQDPDCLQWLGRYQENFPTGTRFRVESTPFYTKAPCYPGLVDRMADLVPDARLLYLVRDPVDRIVAEYVEQMQWGTASRPLDVELAEADDPRNWLVASSRYATQVREFLRRYDRERLKVVDLADLAGDPAAVLGDVFEFLGLDRPDLQPGDFRRFNARDDKGAFPGWLHSLRRGPLLRAWNRLPEGPRRRANAAVWKRLKSPVEAPRPSEESLAALHRVLKPEVDELRELTGAPYATWSL